MNKNLIILSLILVVFLVGCNPIFQREDRLDYRDLDFDLEKIQLTKTFHQTQPYAEFLTKGSIQEDKKLRLLISAGLSEASGLKINRITRDNNNLNIYLETIKEEKNDLSIPQAIVLLDPEDIDRPDKFTFNIINENSEAILLKLAFNEALSIAESSFKLSTVSSPKVNLYKEGDDLIWDIDYEAVMDKSEKDLPLVSLCVKIDANTGKIIYENKEVISKPLDAGNILSLFKGKYLFYKKKVQDKNVPREELWLYNVYNASKTLLFSSEYPISSPHVSTNLAYISFIETTDLASNLYIVPKTSRKAYKLSLEKNIDPVIADWINYRKLCLVEHSDNNSIFYEYDIVTDELKKLGSLDLKVASLSTRNNNYCLLEEDDSGFNDNIYLTRDFKDYRMVAKGYNPRFLNNDNLVYMESKEGKEENIVHIYNLTRAEDKFKFEGMIPSYQIIDDYNILYPIKSDNQKSYSLNKYISYSDSLVEMGDSLTTKAFYSKLDNNFYINLSSPVENDSNMLIYPIKNK